MKQINHISGSLLLLLIACNAFGQNVVFTATVSANKMGQRDQIQLTYTINNADLKSFNTPDLKKEFDITQGPFQQSSMGFQQNGNSVVQTKTISITFVIHPKHLGTITVPAATAVDVAGHTLTSNKVPIQVVAGSLAPAQQQRSRDPFDDPFYDPMSAQLQQQMQAMQQRRGGQHPQQQQTPAQAQAAAAAEEKDIKNDIFIKVAVDKSKVHVGEQITASYKLYARVPMQVSISKLPSLNGFWTQDFTIPKVPKPTEEIVDGKKYQVFLLKKSALFPQQDGTLMLDAAEGEGVARIIVQSRQRDPFAEMLARDPAFSMMMNDPMFNRSFFGGSQYKDVKVHIKSTPVKIAVTPLPANGKPADYSGAVGNFTVSGKLSKTDITTDDAINYTLNISGSGNLKLIETPKLTLPNGLDGYDPTVVDTITGRSTTISGSKIVTYAISAHTPGDYDIPAIPFAYYNPETGKYVMLSTNPMKLHVKQGKHYNPAVATPGNNSNTVALRDIRNIAVQPLTETTNAGKPLPYTAGYWSMYAFPLFALIGVAVWRRRDEELSKDTVLLRNKRANKVALKRLVTAQTLLQQKSQKPFYEEVSKAIWLYLSDKLNIPLSALSRESAREAMAKRKVPEALMQQTENVISECETNLYAQIGGAKAMEHTYAEAVELISKLEDIF